MLPEHSDPVPPSQQVDLDQHAAEIRRLIKTTKDNVLEIGRRLTEGKKLVGRGRWLPWLDREFGWTDDTARRFINIYEFSQREEFDFRNLRKLDVPMSGLYLLAEPSTPAEARTEIIERGQSQMPVEEIKRVIAGHKKAAAGTPEKSKEAPEKKSMAQRFRAAGAVAHALQLVKSMDPKQRHRFFEQLKTQYPGHFLNLHAPAPAVGSTSH
jgi:hypothetical protein